MSLIKIEPALRDMIHILGLDPEIEAIKIFNMGPSTIHIYDSLHWSLW